MLEGVRSIFLEVFVFKGAFEVVMFHFVEAVHVELSDETVDFFVSKVAREDNFFEFDDILDDELQAI